MAPMEMETCRVLVLELFSFTYKTDMTLSLGAGQRLRGWFGGPYSGTFDGIHVIVLDEVTQCLPVFLFIVSNIDKHVMERLQLGSTQAKVPMDISFLDGAKQIKQEGIVLHIILVRNFRYRFGFEHVGMLCQEGIVGFIGMIFNEFRQVVGCLFGNHVHGHDIPIIDKGHALSNQAIHKMGIPTQTFHDKQMMQFIVGFGIMRPHLVAQVAFAKGFLKMQDGQVGKVGDSARHTDTHTDKATTHTRCHPKPTSEMCPRQRQPRQMNMVVVRDVPCHSFQDIESGIIPLSTSNGIDQTNKVVHGINHHLVKGKDGLIHLSRHQLLGTCCSRCCCCCGDRRPIRFREGRTGQTQSPEICLHHHGSRPGI